MECNRNRYVNRYDFTDHWRNHNRNRKAIGINNAAADGSTKGAASFTANDFDASSGNISIDYANG